MKSRIGDISYLKDANKVSIYNGTTREEIVNYYFTTTSPSLGTAIKYINDSVRFPTFSEQDFENEKKVVIGAIDHHTLQVETPGEVADVIVFLCSAAPARGPMSSRPSTVDRWERLVRDIAEEHGVYVAYSSLVGSEGGKLLSGASMIAGPRGDAVGVRLGGLRRHRHPPRLARPADLDPPGVAGQDEEGVAARHVEACAGEPIV